MRENGTVAVVIPNTSRRRSWLGAAGLSLLLLCAASVSCSGAGLVVTVTSSTFYPTFGFPADALVTNTGYVLVSVSAKTPPPFSPTQQTGIRVFKPIPTGMRATPGGYQNPCGGTKIISLPDISLPSGQKTVVSVMGLKPSPSGSPLSSQIGIGAAVEAYGADFFQVANLDACAIEPVVNVQQPPIVTPPACSTCAPGSFDIAFTPDGSHAFVANEYGLAPPIDIKGSGTIGVVKIVRDMSGRFLNQTRRIGPYLYVEGGGAIAGVTISHDGKRLYATSETAKPGFHNPTQISNPVLVRKKDGNNPCIGDPSKPSKISANGLLTVFDVAAAIAGKPALIQSIAAACSPVRIVESSDGKRIWVAARGSNKILAFDVAKLTSQTQVNQSFIGHVHSGGSLPVGMSLFHNDQLLAVANSNRYNVSSGVDNVAIFDVSTPASMRLLTTVPAFQRPNGLSSFPRDITLGPDGSTLFVPNFAAKRLQIIRTSVTSGSGLVE